MHAAAACMRTAHGCVTSAAAAWRACMRGMCHACTGPPQPRCVRACCFRCKRCRAPRCSAASRRPRSASHGEGHGWGARVERARPSRGQGRGCCRSTAAGAVTASTAAGLMPAAREQARPLTAAPCPTLPQDLGQDPDRQDQRAAAGGRDCGEVQAHPPVQGACMKGTPCCAWAGGGHWALLH